MAVVNQDRVYGRYSRLRYEDLIYDERDKTVRIGMKDFTFINNLKSTVTFTTYKIPPQYELRPDLISNSFYGTPELWWVISAYNGFFRLPQDFYVDRVIMVPSAEGVISLLI